MRLRAHTTVLAFVLCFFATVGESQAKITVGTAVPVIAGTTEILINLDTIVHPVKTAKTVGAKIKGVIKRRPKTP